MSTASNWSTGVAPVNGDTLRFNSNGTTQALVNDYASLTLAGTQQIGFGASAGAYTISGNAITLGAGAGNTLANNSSATQTINTDLILSANQMVGINTGVLVLGGVISGSSSSIGINSSAGGVLQLSGDNTFGGGLSIGGGSLVLASATTLAAATGTLAINGGTVSSSVSSTTVGGAVTLAGGILAPNDVGAGTFNLAAGQTFTMSSDGTLNLTLGTAYDRITSAGSGLLSLTGGTINFDTTGAGFSYASTYQLFSGFGNTSYSSLTLSGYDTANFTAAISDSGLLSFTSTAIPEPSTYAAIAGALGLGVALRGRRKAAKATSAGDEAAS